LFDVSGQYKVAALVLQGLLKAGKSQSEVEDAFVAAHKASFEFLSGVLDADREAFDDFVKESIDADKSAFVFKTLGLE